MSMWSVGPLDCFCPGLDRRRRRLPLLGSRGPKSPEDLKWAFEVSPTLRVQVPKYLGIGYKKQLWVYGVNIYIHIYMLHTWGSVYLQFSGFYP